MGVESGQLAGALGILSRRERGAVLIEAALITPLLVMLVFGIWTTARAWNIHNVLDHAAREAARYGAAEPTHSEIETVAEGEVISATVSWGSVTYCASVIRDGAGQMYDGTTESPGQCVGAALDPTTDDRVQVFLRIPNYPLNFVFFTTTVNLEARAVARLEPGA